MASQKGPLCRLGTAACLPPRQSAHSLPSASAVAPTQRSKASASRDDLGCAPRSSRPRRGVEPVSTLSPCPCRTEGAGDRGGGVGRGRRRRAVHTAVRPALGPAGSSLAAAPPAPPYGSPPAQNEETEELAPSCAAGPALGCAAGTRGPSWGVSRGAARGRPPEQVSATAGIGVERPRGQWRGTRGLLEGSGVRGRGRCARECARLGRAPGTPLGRGWLEAVRLGVGAIFFWVGI